MSLFGSLFSGVSGLNAQSRAMGMISDNVANVNTTAYKGAAGAVRQPGDAQSRQLDLQSRWRPRAELLHGGEPGPDPEQRLADRRRDLRCRLLRRHRARPTATGEQLYTRAGSFNPDFQGDLRTTSGYYLQGWALDANEAIVDVNQLETVNVRSINGLAAATTTVGIGANLDADQPAFAGAYAAGDLTAYQASGGTAGVQPTFTRDVQVYDSLGRPHDLTMAFLRTGAGQQLGGRGRRRPGGASTRAHHPNGLLASGTRDLRRRRHAAERCRSHRSCPARRARRSRSQWAAAGGADAEPDRASISAASAASTASASSPARPASPSSPRTVPRSASSARCSIDDQGYVIASFTNGEERRLYQLPIATFANPAGLDPRSGNVYAQTDASGEFNLRVAGNGGAGVVAPSALEAANVDLAEEFTKMIVTQRAYSANAKVINTTDQMLDELIRMAG